MAYMVSIVQPNKHSNLAKQRVNSCDNFSKWCIFWKQSSPWGSGLSLFQHGPESRGPCLETKGNGIFNKKKRVEGPHCCNIKYFNTDLPGACRRPPRCSARKCRTMQVRHHLPGGNLRAAPPDPPRGDPPESGREPDVWQNKLLLPSITKYNLAIQQCNLHLFISTLICPTVS